MALYQSQRLSAYADRLIHAFTGKPITLGGLAFPREVLEENRRAVCERLGIPFERLVVPQQVHSANIRNHCETEFCETDAVVLVEPNAPVMLLYADCTPVVLYSPQDHIGAVIHAGWRGTAQGITRKTVQWLAEHTGVLPENLVAVVGPAIGGCCYEVSQEVAQLVSESTSAPPELYTTLNANCKPQVDLQAVNALQLEAAGVGDVETLGFCTHCQTEDLFSHRRGEAGRQAAILCLK